MSRRASRWLLLAAVVAVAVAVGSRYMLEALAFVGGVIVIAMTLTGWDEMSTRLRDRREAKATAARWSAAAAAAAIDGDLQDRLSDGDRELLDAIHAVWPGAAEQEALYRERTGGIQ